MCIRDSHDTDGQNANGYIHVLEVELFNVLSMISPEVALYRKMAAAQTGSDTVSAHRTARNKIPTAITMCSRYSCSIVLLRIAVGILLLCALELEI